MNLKQLQYVLVLSSVGSFSKAAEKLNISQPSLSQYIKKIESELGTELFVRANGEVRLTDAGQAYVEAGREILSIEHQMQNQLVDIASYKSGSIIVGISPYRSFHLIPYVLQKFDALYPNIELIIKEKSGRELIESATRGEFDICVIALPVDETVFDVEKIQTEEIVIAVNKSTTLYSKLTKEAKVVKNRKFPAVDIGLLDGHDFANLSNFMPTRIATDKLLKEFGIRIHEKIEVSSNEALLTVVQSGVCSSFIPSGLMDESKKDIACFSIKQDFKYHDVAVIRRKDQYLSKPISDLIQIFKACN